MTFFEELESLSNPWVPIKMEFNGKSLAAKIRRPTALESDAIEAFYADEYGSRILRDTDPENANSELNRVRSIYKKNTIEDVVEQLLATRSSEIRRRTFEHVGIDIGEDALKLVSMTDDAEREAFEAERQATLGAAMKVVTEQVRQELLSQPFDELVETLAQVAVNFNAIKQAKRLQNAEFLSHILYDKQGEKVFKNSEHARTLPEETLTSIFDAVKTAIEQSSAPDLPFESAGDKEPNGQPSSSSTSGAATKTGGKRTRTTRASSKQSSTPASAT